MFFYEMHRYFLFRKRMMRRAFTAIFITLRLCSVPSEVSCLCPDLQIHPNPSEYSRKTTYKIPETADTIPAGKFVKQRRIEHESNRNCTPY